MTGKVFLDTNILVYAHDHGTPHKKEKSIQLILQCLKEDSGVISPQVLSEFFVTVTQKAQKTLSISHARKEVIRLSRLEVIDMDSTMVIRGITLKERWQLSYWDALILAAAERAECHTLFSEDFSAGQIFDKVTVRNPYK